MLPVVIAALLLVCASDVSAWDSEDPPYVNACTVPSYTFSGKDRILCAHPKGMLCSWLGNLLRPSEIFCNAYLELDVEPPSRDAEWRSSLIDPPPRTGRWMERRWTCSSDRRYIFDTELRCKDLPCPDMNSDCIAMFNLVPTLQLAGVVLGSLLFLSMLLVVTYHAVRIASSTPPLPSPPAPPPAHLFSSVYRPPSEPARVVTPSRHPVSFLPSGKMD